MTLFSYEMLGLVGRTGAAPHDLLRMAKRGRMLDWAGESQYYVEPKRLARLGYLDDRKEPGQTRERTVYALTDEGLDALADWAQTPVHFTALKSEALLRLLITDLVGEAPTRASMTTLRDDLADLLARLNDVEATAHTLPHRRKYLLLVTASCDDSLHSTSTSSTKSNAKSTQPDAAGRHAPHPAPDAPAWDRHAGVSPAAPLVGPGLSATPSHDRSRRPARRERDRCLAAKQKNPRH